MIRTRTERRHLYSVYAQGRDGGGHIKRRSHAEAAACSKGHTRGLPQSADCSRGGNSRAGKRPPRAVEAAHAIGFNRMSAVES
ncbi:hypothetical protein GW17_00008420 [Ensete ventricosum]|nr:hypothetical protein GW17_00008420 [Ensete ventricosum]